MKKVFILGILLLFLCGCSNKRTVQPILNNISFTAVVEYNSNNYNADVTILNESLNMVVIEPKEISGLMFSVDKSGVTAEFNGISQNVDINSFSQGNVASIIFSVIDDIAQKNTVCGEENCEITGRVDDHQYRFSFSPTGLPLSLEFDDINLKIKFNNVTLK